MNHVDGEKNLIINVLEHKIGVFVCFRLVFLTEIFQKFKYLQYVQRIEIFYPRITKIFVTGSIFYSIMDL